MNHALPQRALTAFALACALGATTAHLGVVRAAPPAPPAPPPADAGAAAARERADVEPPAETRRVTDELHKANADAEARLKVVTAEHDRLDHDPADAEEAKAKADCERRLSSALREAAETSALLRAAQVEPYMPAGERERVRALPRAERLNALAARPAEEVLRILVPEVKMDGVGLADALDFLRDVAPLNLYVDWRAAESAGVDRNTPVTFKAENASVGDLLALILRSAREAGGKRAGGKGAGDLQVATDDNVALVTSKAGLEADDRLARRLAAAAADPKAKALLDRRLPDTRFDAVGLSDVIDFLRDVTGANFFADWKRLEAAGADRNAPLRLRLGNVRFGLLLRLLAAELRDDKGRPLAAFTMADGVVQLSTPAGLDAMAAARKELDALSAEDEKARAAFAKRLPELHLESVGLKDVCDFLKDVTGTSVEADWDGLTAGCPPDTQVTLRLRDVTTGDALLYVTHAAAGEQGPPRIGFERGRILLLKPAKPKE